MTTFRKTPIQAERKAVHSGGRIHPCDIDRRRFEIRNNQRGRKKVARNKSNEAARKWQSDQMPRGGT
jgi:hypothetical protein